MSIPVRLTSGLLDTGYPVLLDSSLVRPGLGRYSYVTADPFLVVRSKGSRVEVMERGGVTLQKDNPFSVVQRLLADFRTDRCKDGPPFQGGAIGYFGYEMGGLLERLPRTAVDDLALPDMSIGFYDWVIAFDHASGQSWLVTTKFSREGRAEWVRDHIAKGFVCLNLKRTGYPLLRLISRSNFTREGYVEAVKRVKEVHMPRVTSTRQTSPSDSRPLSIPTHGRSTNALRNTAPAPFGAYLGLPWSLAF